MGGVCRSRAHVRDRGRGCVGLEHMQGTVGGVCRSGAHVRNRGWGV